MRTLGIASGLSVLVVTFAAVVPALAQEEPEYAPVDRPGPELQVPETELRDRLVCTGDLAAGEGGPVLLIPGTTLTPAANFSWNYEPALQADGRA